MNVGVRGGGVVKYGVEEIGGKRFEVVCESMKGRGLKIRGVGEVVGEEGCGGLNVGFGMMEVWLGGSGGVGESVGEIVEEMGLEYGGGGGRRGGLGKRR